MNHNIIILDGNLFLDDSSRKIVRIEPSFVYYQENENMKIETNVDTKDFLNEFANKSNLSFTEFENQYLENDKEFILDVHNRKVCFVNGNNIEKLSLSDENINTVLDYCSRYLDADIRYPIDNNEIEKELILKEISENEDSFKRELDSESIINGHIKLLNVFSDEDKMIYTVMDNGETYYVVEDASLFEQRQAEARRYLADNVYVVIDNSINYDNPGIKSDDNQLLLTDDGEVLGNIVFIEDSLEKGQKALAIVSYDDDTCFSKTELEITDDFIKRINIDNKELIDINENRISGLSNFIIPLESNVENLSIKNPTLEDMSYSKENGSLIAIENINGNKEQKKFVNVQILDEDKKDIRVTDTITRTDKIYTVNCSNEDWNSLKKSLNEVSENKNFLKKIGTIEKGRLETKYFIEHNDGKLEDVSDMRYVNLDSNFLIYSSGNQLKFSYFSNEMFDSNQPDMKTLKFADIREGMFVDDNGVHKLTPEESEKYIKELKKIEIPLKNGVYLENKESSESIDIIKNNAISLGTNALHDAYIVKDLKGIFVCGKDEKNNEYKGYINEIKESGSKLSQLIITDNNSCDFRIDSFSSDFQYKDIKTLVKDISKDISTFEMHDIYILEGHSGVFTKFNNEYLCITNPCAETINIDDAKSEFNGKITGKMYRTLISESAKSTLNVGFDKISDNEILISREDNSLYNNHFITSIDVIPSCNTETVQLKDEDFEKISDSIVENKKEIGISHELNTAQHEAEKEDENAELNDNKNPEKAETLNLGRSLDDDEFPGAF